MDSHDLNYWRKCSSCKHPIGFNITYWVCNVTTCNKKRTGLVFCSVNCWDTHLPIMKHRDAWAEERKSPTKRDVQSEESAVDVQPKRRIITQRTRAHSQMQSESNLSPQLSPKDILIVASKLKLYIKERSGGMNTSSGVLDILSDHVRVACDRAIESARANGRKTVLDRDF